MLLRTFLYTSLGKHRHAVLQGIYLVVELLDDAKLFSKVVVPVHTFTSIVCRTLMLCILEDNWLLADFGFKKNFYYQYGFL